MLTKYHLSSAQEIDSGILDAIKATFKSKAITIIVEEDEEYEDELTEEQKMILDNRLQEDEAEYMSAEESLNRLNKKYGL